MDNAYIDFTYYQKDLQVGLAYSTNNTYIHHHTYNYIKNLVDNKYVHIYNNTYNLIKFMYIVKLNI